MIWVIIVETVILAVALLMLATMCVIALAAYMVLDRHGVEGPQRDREIDEAREFIVNKWFGKRTR